MGSERTAGRMGAGAPSKETALALAKKGKEDLANLLTRDAAGDITRKDMDCGLQEGVEIFEQLLNIHIHAGGT